MSTAFDDEPILLTEEEQADLQAWVDAVRPMLALSDWAITVTRHQCGGKALASTYVRDHGDIAIIALGAVARSWPAEELRQTLTHELLHPHFQRITRMAEKLVESELGTRAEGIITAAIEIVEEQTIDRVATAISRFLPLPEALA